jgi:hypothetical protein
MILDINNFSHLNNETPDLTNNFFNINKKTLIKKKILIISGGSRNGNHLVCSSLDNHPQLPCLPGEDRVLSEIFWNYLNNPKKFIKKLGVKNTYKFIASLSGVHTDKWKLLSKKKITNKHKKYWAGNHPKGFVPLLEYPDQQYADFNHELFLKTLKNKFKKKPKNFEYFFISYLEALSKLINKKKTKFDFIYANSGLRRELYYLCKKKFDVKIIVPIRKFETFYFSKIFGRYKTNEINDNNMKEAWSHWKNKTVDYLILKKLFPKNIFIVKFEDLADKKNKEKYLKKICKFLNIPFDKCMKENTFMGKQIKPNSSFTNEEIKNSNAMNIELIPEDYGEIYNEVKKRCY